MDWDLRLLRYFVKVAEMENISRAATALGVTQPGLSRLIRKFEDDMGFPLFERGARSLNLTREGRMVLEEGRQLLSYAELKWKRITEEIGRGEIRIGYSPSLGHELLEIAVGCFSQKHPMVKLTLLDLDTRSMCEKVEDGSIDLMLSVSSEDPQFSWLKLRKLNLCGAVSSNHPLAAKKVITPDDLNDVRLLLFSKSDYPAYWEQVSGFFVAHGINARVAGEFDGSESLNLGLEAGLGLALVTTNFASGDKVKKIPLDPAPEPVCVAVGWNAEIKPQEWTLQLIGELQAAADSLSQA